VIPSQRFFCQSFFCHSFWFRLVRLIIQKFLMILPKIILPSKIPGLRHWRLWRHACPAPAKPQGMAQARGGRQGRLCFFSSALE
jgi:hypothetical protein